MLGTITIDLFNLQFIAKLQVWCIVASSYFFFHQLSFMGLYFWPIVPYIHTNFFPSVICQHDPIIYFLDNTYALV